MLTRKRKATNVTTPHFSIDSISYDTAAVNSTDRDDDSLTDDFVSDEDDDDDDNDKWRQPNPILDDMVTKLPFCPSENDTNLILYRQLLVEHCDYLQRQWICLQRKKKEQRQGRRAKRRRVAPRIPTHIDWDVHIAQMERQDDAAFNKIHRLSTQSFHKLLTMIQPTLTSCAYSHNVGGTAISAKIIPEIMLHCTLRWLAGETKVSQICEDCDITKRAFYRVVRLVMYAILSCELLSIDHTSPPALADIVETQLAQQQLNRNNNISYSKTTLEKKHIMVTSPNTSPLQPVIVSMFIRIKKPSDKDLKLPKGGQHHQQQRHQNQHHAQMYFNKQLNVTGLNVRLGFSCNQHCPQISFVNIHPGGQEQADITNDKMIPLPTSSPGEKLQYKIPKLMSRATSSIKLHDNKVVMLLTSVWKILNKTLTVDLKCAGNIIMTIVRLHNFVICERAGNIAELGGRGEASNNNDYGSTAATTNANARK